MVQFCGLSSEAAKIMGAIRDNAKAPSVRTSIEDLAALIDQLVTEREVSPFISPDSLVIDRLAAHHAAGSLTLDEIAALVLALVLAGTEMTDRLMANVAYLAAVHPEVLDLIQGDPASAGRVIDELLRWQPISKGLVRWATSDTEINGTPVAAGEMVFLSFGAANSDPAAFACPHQFNPSRPDVASHLAFGTGEHACLGADLARLEATTLLHSIAHRYQAIEIYGSPRWLAHPATRGFGRLELSITPR